jgi:signal transduction histidine kinase
MESVAFLASGVAHTFNNLLTPMIGYANILRGELPPDKTRMAEIIVESGERAAQLVKHLLAYAGKGQFVTREVDLAEAVLSVWDLLEASMPELVRLNRNLEPGMPPIAADPDQIEQIVINLVRNAAEAIPQGRAGTITVRTALEELAAGRSVIDALSQTPLPPGRYACIEVRDDGSGIEQDDMPKLFDPFFTTKFTGRGLGLPAAAGIVRAHQGAIEVETAVGQGSTFRIYFPVDRSAG